MSRFRQILPTFLVAVFALSALADPGGYTKQFVDFHNPPRIYQSVNPGRLQLFTEDELLKGDLQLAQRAAQRLETKVEAALSALPRDASAPLRQLPFFLMFGTKARSGGRDSGLEYFGARAPYFRPELDERWRNCIVVFSAENYAKITDLWALKAVLHEYGHAYHLTHWIEKQPDILQAWQHAMNRGLYRNVRDDQGRIVANAYASTNQLEYFAELTCVYFARCNYYPFNRNDLRGYDPEGYAMIEKMWFHPPAH